MTKQRRPHPSLVVKVLHWLLDELDKEETEKKSKLAEASPAELASRG